MAGTKGKQQTVRDMVLSLGLIVLAGMVMYLFVPHDDDQEPDIQRVDYRIEVITARRAAAYPVAAPQGLPQTWKATSVRFDGQEHDTWHLGFHAPDGEYVTVKQSTGKRIPFIEEATQGAQETEVTEEIGGRTWVRYTGGRYDALVLAADDDTRGTTTVVAGTGSFDQLATMVKALRTS
ncbi:DUF4245 domain-containing protein [Streptomyces cinereospinus]|uniref:DUF4245 domain-containing protein n=1 Tax=Streptomyces cinereospinus TaxID=285561 RepID=A0ABV5N1Z0_9ACTN